MKLLEARTSFVPFPPYLDINSEPVDIFDKLTWSEHFYNHLLRVERKGRKVLFRDTNSEKTGMSIR